MSKLTKQQKERYIKMYNWRWDTIYSAYKNPSQKKQNAYEYICDIARDMDGTTPRVISHNTFHFTTAFKFWRQGNPILRVDTATHIYMFDMISLEDYEGDSKMEKYNIIMKQLAKEHKTRTSPVDDLYIIGKCHAIQNIALNDTTITREEYGDIYTKTEIIIKEILNL